MSHRLSLHATQPQEKCEGGYRLRATKSNFPALEGMSFYKLGLDPYAIRKPHWHANADELGYCLQGKLLVSLYGNRNERERFIVSEGEAFFIPSGALHGIENIGEKSAEVVLQFSHEEPDDFEISSVFGSFSDAVLGNTWGEPSSHFRELKRSLNLSPVTKVTRSSEIFSADHYLSPYQFPLEKSAPLIENSGGSAKTAKQNVWPILKRQALFSLRLTGQGMREPHWHPETAEMGYIVKGRGRMSVISPLGKIDTYLMQAGDLYFIPKAYPHHIENLDTSPLHLLVFFDQATAQDIGFSASIKSFSDEALAATVGSKPGLFANLPTYYEDLFLVPKKNPLDPF